MLDQFCDLYFRNYCACCFPFEELIRNFFAFDNVLCVYILHLYTLSCSWENIYLWVGGISVLFTEPKSFKWIVLPRDNSQITLLLHELYQKILTVYDNELRLFIGQDITSAVGTIFNVYSYDAE